ncbi:translation initiation factor IF-3, mitochondrial [Drosophila innubila]|uniref:translation initiation factor IF-3, mitochondrial n=1 Tax=Drosophila innubila TaxID=198719 RepID=UPI00148DC86C|nr:translation initiation factor IF-3, mitochondrial [Drosophila innubila]
MQQQRLFIIRKLFLQHSVALQLPRCPKITTVPAQQSQMRNLAFHRYLTQGTTTTRDNGQKANKSQQKITLIAQNQAMSVTTLDEAQKLAKRRDLHLLRLNQTDAKTGRVVFRLVTAAEMLADDQDDRGAAKSASEKGSKKTEKSLTIGARITDHDLASRLKNIAKWLNKRHEVRILIQGSSSGADEGNAERIVKTIESTIKEPQVIGKIVQKRHKGALIKFSILPVATTTTPTPPTVNQS